MDTLAEQIAKARQAGHSDKDIADYLAKSDPRIQQARSAGHADSDILGYLAAPAPTKPAPNPKQGDARMAFTSHQLNALLFGMGNSFAAAANSDVNDPTSYGKNLEKYRASSAEDERDHPVASGAGTLTGALTSPLNALLPGGLLTGGAVAGGVNTLGAGAGDNKSASDKAIDVGFGTAVGAASAGVLGTLAKLGLGSSAAQRVIAAATKDDGVMAELQNLVAQGKGKIATLADLSPKLRDLLDKAATKSVDVTESVRDIVNGRQPSTAGRLAADFRAANTSATATPLAQRASQMSAQRLSFADGPQGFQGLRDKYTSLPVGRDLTSVLAKPGMSDALEQVKLADKLNGTNVSQQIQKSFGSGGLGLTAMAPNPNAQVTYTAAAQFERALDGKAEAAFRSGNVPLANSYKTLRNGVGDFLEEAVPQHAAVKATYAKMKANEAALQQGYDWFGGNGDDIAYGFGKLSPAAKDAARQGWASAALEHISSKNSNLDPSTVFANASDDMDKQARLMFPSEAKFDEFMAKAKSEQSLSRLRGTISGSGTAGRQEDGTVGVGAAANFASSMAKQQNPLSAGLHAILPDVLSNVGAKSAAERGALLTTQGAPEIQALIDKLRAATANDATLRDVGVGAGGGMSGLLSQLLATK